MEKDVFIAVSQLIENIWGDVTGRDEQKSWFELALLEAEEQEEQFMEMAQNEISVKYIEILNRQFKGNRKEIIGDLRENRGVFEFFGMTDALNAEYKKQIIHGQVPEY